jgi:hypothetical protein
LKEPDYDRAPTMKVKVGFWGGKWDDNLEFYDLQNKMIFPNEEDPSATPELLIPAGGATKTAVSIKSGGIYFASGKCGVTWKLHQAVVKPKPKMGGRCLIKLPKDVVDKLESEVDEEVQETVNKVQATIVEDSDDENDGGVESEPEAEVEEEREPTPEPEPAPAPVKKTKKVVRKKAT